MPASGRVTIEYMHSRLKRALALRDAATAACHDVAPFVEQAMNEFPYHRAPYATVRALLDAYMFTEEGLPPVDALRGARAIHRI